MALHGRGVLPEIENLFPVVTLAELPYVWVGLFYMFSGEVEERHCDAEGRD